MSATVSGIQIGMQCLLENARRMSIEDWMVIPLQWQESLYTPGRKLRIGWYDYDGFFPATPGCKRAVREVTEKLEEAGHHVQEWKNRDHSEIANVFNEIMLSDGGYHSLAAWKGEILDQSIEMNVLRFKTPLFLHGLVSFLSGLVSQKLKLLWDAGPIKTKDLWLVNGSKDRLITEFVSDWNNHDFDIVICPGFPFPAPPPQYPSRILSGTHLPVSFRYPPPQYPPRLLSGTLIHSILLLLDYSQVPTSTVSF
ncbi:fatty acid amide hydrolase 1 [Eurytemora carolleeae]|uniref:fatty acid amide hydrolase 1 n=1 Tax=Eurytemora carolleeae TaxID=1294199 RepID=UPI000C777A22|nr:fatty acid amide hydrolase 1 [Eurytemora carolleeae]|eukprot:XP_023344205.1 fatty acid amide hydrolase 1-like [Eurytemora affinis]